MSNDKKKYYEAKQISYWLLRSLIFPLVRLMWRPQLTEGSAIPEGPCFIYGNHSSKWDPFILNYCIKPKITAGIMAEEYLNTPFVGKHLRGIGIFPTKKTEPEPELIRDIIRLVKHDRLIMIYPQGGRSWTGNVDTWIPSTSKLFRGMQIPIYPVVIHGSYQAWPRWARYPRPARIQVEIKSPLVFDKKADLDGVKQSLIDSISTDEHKAPEAWSPKWAYKPGSGVERILYRNPDTGKFGGLTCSDGRTIVDEFGQNKYTILDDSRIAHTNKSYTESASSLLDQIRLIPDDIQSETPLSSLVRCTEVVKSSGIRTRSKGTLLLESEQLIFRSDQVRSIDLEDILFWETSKADSLVITLSTSRLTFKVLDKTGPLPWFDAIQKRKP